ncbi:unnamed protein product [Nezara viridula]|uniref:Legumain prodomain domain-containing protein n=1 Tax=Nezara viridula TaxID=85310 RepID=A0A9P0E3F9_NEZVI|nr:unnamed protein product [Nezara viridula]
MGVRERGPIGRIGRWHKLGSGTQVGGGGRKEARDCLRHCETLFDNYNAIRSATEKSHVQLYGDYRLGFLKQFYSDKVGVEYLTEYPESLEETKDVNSREIPLHFARMKLKAAKGPGSVMLEKLEQLIKSRVFADKLISNILEMYTEGDLVSQTGLETERQKFDINMFSCYEDLLDAFDNNCLSIPKNTYFLTHLYKFANICMRDESSIMAMTTIQTVCKKEMPAIHKLGTYIE